MTLPPNVLGVQVAQGNSPEARVFARLLAHRGGRYSARVFHHSSADDRESAIAFEALSGVKVDRFDFGFRYSPPGLRRYPVQLAARLRLALILPRLVKAARGRDVSLVYGSQQRWDSQVGGYLASKLRRPHVIHLHYNIGWWLGSASLERLKSCAHIVTVSDFIRRQAIEFGVPADRVTTVRNTMSPAEPQPAGTRDAVRAELGIPRDATVLGSIARLDYYKGQADAIAAFALVAEAHKDAYLLLAGDGTPEVRDQLHAQVAELGLGSRVLFTGHRSDIGRLHAAIDVFVHPARADPCPLGVLEASAAGLPVVAYAHGGVPELVSDRETGLLVNEGDISDLAGAMGTLVADPALRLELGAAGADRVSTEFRPEAAGQAFADVLEGVAARRS